MSRRVLNIVGESMTTKFDIGDKVYSRQPAGEFGWVEKIIIDKRNITYVVRYPDKELHYKVETSLKKEYYG